MANAPLKISEMGLEGKMDPMQKADSIAKKEEGNKGKGRMGSEDPFYSADSDLSLVESDKNDKMEINQPSGLGDMGQMDKGCSTSRLRNGKAKLKKSTQKILRERANRSKLLAKK